MKNPVVMVGYARMETLKRSMDNLCNCHGIEDRDVFVFIDAAYRPEDEVAVQAMIALSKSYQQRFSRLHVVPRSRNMGVPGNMIHAIGEVVNRFGRVIFFEDDVLVSRTYLQYMDKALDCYENDKRIFCINGWKNPLLFISKCCTTDVFLSQEISAWGVGVWKDRWNAVDFNIVEWPSFRASKKRVRDIYRKLGPVCISLLDGIIAGSVRTWDVQCTFHMYKEGQFAVTPRLSLTKNIGFGVESLHSEWLDWNVITQKYYDFQPNLPDCLQPNPSILRKFGYHSKAEWFLRGVGRVVLRNLVRWGPRHDEPIPFVN